MKPIHCIFSALLLGISLTLIPVPSFSADLQKGLDAYNRGDYQAALREWRPLAEQGDADAQVNLSHMYHEGRGVAQSDAEAVKCYTLAAQQGNAMAQFNLGVMHYQGKGVLQDNIYAHMWWNISASLGNEYASRSSEITAEIMTPADVSKAQ